MVHISAPTDRITSICCIGAGYVGGPTCAVIAAKCPEIRITVVDRDPDRISAWNSDSLPVYEPGLDALVKRQRNTNLTFSTDIDRAIDQAQLIFIAVNTPPMPHTHGSSSMGAKPDLSAVSECARRIARVSLTDKIVVAKSTVPCGACATIAGMLRDNGQKGVGFSVLSNPEFLSEGTAVRDLLHPDRVLIGGDDRVAQDKLKAVYMHWVPEPRILTMNTWSSELAKLASNAMLAQRVSSINSISAVCEAVGADIAEVARGCGSDERIGQKFLRPSLGFGGSCFHKDIASLIWLSESLGLPEVAEYWHQVLALNRFQIKRFVARILADTSREGGLSGLGGRRVACLGFAFKEGTGDTRNTPAADVCCELLRNGAKLSIYDPRVPRHHIVDKLAMSAASNCDIDSVSVCSDAYSAIAGSDIVVVLTAWSEFRQIDWEQALKLMSQPAYVFDGQVVLDHGRLEQLGFNVFSIGRAHVTTQ
ncbi:hypothetical protein GGI15_002352 [Coemansia interrupta]|uniref:UDP-glucose 6-dehydrogenase n=1 Tax=Coemansia interrupta TaxID=1126814 RepID=A0A9W8HDB2_9FUNG|nr:hypothetical protein GGI15_002352 [Coemansia interrupta]